MIKKVTVTNSLNESLALELKSPEKSGFFVWSVEGLGPSKATINVTDVLSIDGAVYNSARVNSRNILLSLGFLENPTIEESRQKTYKFFPLKKPVKITIETDKRHCFINGYVEANDIDIFSPRESAVISVICPNPYFYSFDTNITLFSGSQPMFSFPFSNESLTEKLIVFGDISTNTEQSVFYEGDADVGIMIYIHVLGPVTDLTIYNLDTRESMFIDTSKVETITGGPVDAGDDIVISTVKGNKYIYLQRAGVITNILNALDKDTSWFQITKGDNLFSYTAVSGLTYLQFRIENQTIYEGI